MATTSRTRRASNPSGGRTTLTVGPFKGVRTTSDPYDDPPDLLNDLLNGYIPDPAGGSGVYSRPGFTPMFGGAQVYTSGAPFRGQAVYSHPAIDGTTTNFFVIGGHLFRVNDAYTTATDVTPVGVTIDGMITTKVYFVSVIGQLVVTDGVNRPWIATNLKATPITGTYIDYDGHGVAWTAFGKPALYQNAIFYILNTVNGISRHMDLSWSEPGLPTIGLQQDNFDDNWTLTTSSNGPIYAIQGTDNGLFYWRDLSIGSATGTVGPNLASDATEDAVSFNVGAQAPQTIQQFGNSFFFCDAIGRPWRFVPGTPPEPLWFQMRGIVNQQSTSFQSTTAIVATSVIEPTLNLWLVGIWSPLQSNQAPVSELYAFDAHTGTYMGRWRIGPGIAIECLGTFVDNSGRVTVIVLGSLLGAPAAGGYVWIFNGLSSEPQFLTTEDGRILTTEDGVPLTTEGQPAVWQDNGQLMDVRATTGRLGYADNTVMNADMARVITLSKTAVSVSVQTSAAATTLEGSPVPSTSQDGTCRLVCGLDVFGRGPQVTVKPLDTTGQWSLQSVSVDVVPSMAGVDDA